MFFIVAVAMYDWRRFQTANPTNRFVDQDEKYGPRESFMINHRSLPLYDYVPLVVVSGLSNEDLILLNRVDQSMLICDAP